MDLRNFIYTTALVMSLLYFSCDEEADRNAAVLAGYWVDYKLSEDGLPERTGLTKIALDEDGYPYKAVIYEEGLQSRAWINFGYIEYDKGKVNFNDEFSGRISSDKDTIYQKYKHYTGQMLEFISVRTKDSSVVRFLDKMEASTDLPYEYKVPIQNEDGLMTASADQYFDMDILNEMCRDIKAGHFGDLHSLLIVKNSDLVIEEYFNSSGKLWGDFITDIYRDKLHNIASVSKSVISVLFGIAQNTNSDLSVDSSLYLHFKNYRKYFNTLRNEITIKDLLTMSTGLEWNELDVPYQSSHNDAVILNNSPDPLDYTIGKAPINKPGYKFSYSTGNSFLLAEIIDESVEAGIESFADSVLFSLLNIRDRYWYKLADTIYAGLALTSRGLVKIGMIMLNGGLWKGTRLVPEKWVTESITPYFDHYAYQWWIRTFEYEGKDYNAVYALGLGGKTIFIFPELNMVVVTTAENYGNNSTAILYELISDYILPAIKH